MLTSPCLVSMLHIGVSAQGTFPGKPLWALLPCSIGVMHRLDLSASSWWIGLISVYILCWGAAQGTPPRSQVNVSLILSTVSCLFWEARRLENMGRAVSSFPSLAFACSSAIALLLVLDVGDEYRKVGIKKSERTTNALIATRLRRDAFCV